MTNPKPFHLNQIPADFVEEDKSMATLYLGDAAGSEKLYANIDRVQPGAKSTKYHTHSLQEEFFLILAGSGILRLNGEEYPVTKGSFVAKPAGKNIAHQFINTGNEVLEILDVGTKVEGDVAYYPDEDVYFLRKEKKMFKGSEAMMKWDSEPNK
ncbi:cupin domain-containing protein [Brevibacillus reuszeri]|uniref:Mannose-6-phosphate isomerase n=2 Tax=Brevibacillus reuszeri TaxID=54915 RepID=A0A0K9YLV0_9BACL|nr:cupin domain-containing protein [Brevibacillus reuszeri]KNB69713.1 mannose-6-phosphate isomerase [Brevibacillus reuszeri]MED1858054.1 cupin domain-containing protein [Brevibacillus reuszeri]